MKFIKSKDLKEDKVYMLYRETTRGHLTCVFSVIRPYPLVSDDSMNGTVLQYRAVAGELFGGVVCEEKTPDQFDNPQIISHNATDVFYELDEEESALIILEVI